MQRLGVNRVAFMPAEQSRPPSGFPRSAQARRGDAFNYPAVHLITHS